MSGASFFSPTHHEFRLFIQYDMAYVRFMANIQRNGTFSVVPRMPAGEVSPEGLIAIGEVARDYGLYTKVTGGTLSFLCSLTRVSALTVRIVLLSGQRIDLFGAHKQDLPDIWERLGAAGFESGHAYGKSLRTVKSCVGTSWCRYGVGDSVGLAVELESRYKGVRAVHKFKGGVSGCVRECAEAQSKDFGLIATDKGWNGAFLSFPFFFCWKVRTKTDLEGLGRDIVFIGGNGGMTPRHGTLFAVDVPPSKVVRIIDRFVRSLLLALSFS